MEDIDYTEKIATFNLLVGNNNEEIAFNYLSLTNWDESKAAILYNQENKGAQAKYQSTIKISPLDDYPKNNNIYKNKTNNNNKKKTYNNYNNNYLSNTQREPKLRSEKLNYNNLVKLNNYSQCRIFKKGFFDKINLLKKDNKVYFPNFKNISEKCEKSYNVFINNLKNNVGVILLYNQRTLNEAVNILKELMKKDTTKYLLSSRTQIIPLIEGSLEGNKTIKELKIKNFPCIVICFYKNDNYFAVIAKINNIMNNIILLNDKLLEAYDLFNDKKSLPSLINDNIPIFTQTKNDTQNFNKNNSNKNNTNYITKKNSINNIKINNSSININNKNNNNINSNIMTNNNLNNINVNNNSIENKEYKKQNLLDDINNFLPYDDDIDFIKRDSYSNMTDGEVLAKQEREMKSLEKMAEKQRLEEEKKEKEKKEEEQKKQEEELMEKIQVESILEILPEEPSDDNPDKTIILFRFPDGEKVVQRKFLKTDNISMLYLYIKSLGREIYSETEETHFSLIQSFPFKNFDEVQNNSLEKEGLFPNAVLQIKAIE